MPGRLYRPLAIILLASDKIRAALDSSTYWAGTGWDVRCGLQRQAHLDQIPQLAIGAPDIACESAILDEAGLALQGDRGVVVREDAQGELVQAAVPRPPDRRRGRPARLRPSSRARQTPSSSRQP